MGQKELSMISPSGQKTKHQSDEELQSLEDRTTDELVIGFVGPVGSGVTTTCKLFKKLLLERYAYDKATVHKISDIIIKAKDRLNLPDLEKLNFETNRITSLQEAGNVLRSKISTSYLSEKVVEVICTDRQDTGFHEESDKVYPKAVRHVHLIDSLKHPDEVDLLRRVYGETFWLIGIFAPKHVRQSRIIKEPHQKEPEVMALMEKDEDDDFEQGQKVRDTIHLSDFFVRNDGENRDKLQNTIQRYLDILFRVDIHTPTCDETAMYTAASAAKRSACLSRQVGAAIYSSKGELLGVGANDPPKKGGGTYTTDQKADDNRCYKWLERECHNDHHKNLLYDHLLEKLTDANVLKDGVDLDKVRKVLSSSKLKDLIEYSRAVHAEMEAIISIARAGTDSLIGSKLFCTTYPCHNCARHIIAAGIEKVVYIEPYDKSLALKLHSDALTGSESEKEKKVHFVQYEGVAPKNIVRLFSAEGSRKGSDGKAVINDPATAKPVFPPPLDGFAHREKMITTKLEEKEKNLQSR